MKYQERLSVFKLLKKNRTCNFRCAIVFDAQALLKNQKVALLAALRGAFLGNIGNLVFNEF